MSTDELMDARLRAAGQRWRSTVEAVEPKPVADKPKPRYDLGLLLTAAVIVAALILGGAVVWPRMTHQRSAAPGAGLVGPRWDLVSYAGRDGVSHPAAGSAYVTFGNVQVVGSDGCNSFSGPSRISGDQVNFGSLAMTAIGCLSSGPWAVVDDVIVAQVPVTWSINGGVLTLRNGTASLVYKRWSAPHASSLIGTDWQLTTIDRGSSSSTPTTPSSLSFSRNGTYRLVHDCYSIEDNQVAITAATMVFPSGTSASANCPNQADNQFVDQVLTGTVQWQIVDGQLTLTKSGLGALVFREVAPGAGPASGASTMSTR